MLDLRAEIDAIVANPDPASFENTIVAMEKVGGTVQRVLYTFFPLVGTELNNELRALQREISPIWSRETDAITFNEELFKRVKNVYEQREDLDLDEQDARLLELTYRRFLRAGANLPDDDKREVADINSRLSVLSTQFAQNLLAATKGFAIELTDEADTSGLSEDFQSQHLGPRKGGLGSYQIARFTRPLWCSHKTVNCESNCSTAILIAQIRANSSTARYH